jgi:hypothetical protein
MALSTPGYGYGYNVYNRFRNERFPTDPRASSPGAGPSALGPTPRFRPSAPQRGGESSRFYGSRNPKSGVLTTGWGVKRPKLLSFRRFTSKWLPPAGGRGLLQPNPAYMGGAGDFNPEDASSRGFGRMPGMGTYGSYAVRGLPFMRPTL